MSCTIDRGLFLFFQDHIGVPYQDVDKRAALILHNDHNDGTILMVSLSSRVVTRSSLSIEIGRNGSYIEIYDDNNARTYSRQLCQEHYAS